MNRKLYSILLIVITLITCTYISLYKTSFKEEIKDKKDNNTEISTENKKNEEFKESKQIKEKEEEDKKEIIEKEVPKIEDDNNMIIDEGLKGDNMGNDKENIYLVSVDKINISTYEKLVLLNIYRKLNKEDEAKINAFFGGEGDKDSVIETLQLLKSKLSNKDYKTIKDIASNFINMDLVEN